MQYISGMSYQTTKGFPNPVVHNWVTKGHGVAHTRTLATFGRRVGHCVPMYGGVHSDLVVATVVVFVATSIDCSWAITMLNSKLTLLFFKKIKRLPSYLYRRTQKVIMLRYMSFI